MANYFGTTADDILDFQNSSTDDLLDGLEGADLMRGGDGNDTYIVDNLGDVVEEFFADAQSGYDTVQSSVSFTLSNGIDRLILTGTASNSGTGNALDNEIQGNSGNNTLDGLDGGDIINGGGGNDTIRGGAGADTLSGGNDFDTLSYAGSSDAVLVNLDLNSVFGGDATGDVISNFENLVGSDRNDSLLGDGANNVIDGGDGNDILQGDNKGGGGADTLYGGNGNDDISGAGGNDSVDGGDGDDNLTGGDGDDTLDGGVGSDTANYSEKADAITVALNASVPVNVTIGAETDSIVNIENVFGGGGSDVITGDGNTIFSRGLTATTP